MKKVLAVLLGVLMLVCVLPAGLASAETIDFTDSRTFNDSKQLVSGNTYAITNEATMTVPAGLTLYVPAGVTLVVEEGSVLNVLGTIVVNVGGVIRVEGSVLHASNITIEEGAVAVTAVDIAPVGDYISDAVTFDDAPYGVSVLASFKGADGTAAKDYKDVDVTAGGKVYVQLNTQLAVSVRISEPYNVATHKEESRFDESLFKVFVDGAPITFLQGACSFNVPDRCRVTFGDAQRDSDFYRECRIYMPSGTGYRIVGRDGECAEDGVVKAKYGSKFSFIVELDDTFDRSATEVFCYDGYSYFGLKVPADGEYLSNKTPLVADASGYYTIDIDCDKTIQVEGALSNDSIGKVTGIMDIMKNILDMVLSFFRQIAEFFGISL